MIAILKDSDICDETFPSGHKGRYIQFEDIKIPLSHIATGFIPDIRENIKVIKSLPCRDDDIFLCAAPKAGIKSRHSSRPDSHGLGEAQ